MYESLTIGDFYHILYIIRDNHKQHPSLTHKEVRVYLNCMEQLWSEIFIPDSYYLPSIKFHFYAMSCRISHEKRAFLANRLLDLLVLLKQPNLEQVDGLTKVVSPVSQEVSPFTEEFWLGNFQKSHTPRAHRVKLGFYRHSGDG